MGTNTYQRIAVKVDNLTVMGLDQLWAIWRRNKQMFGKLGEMFLESGHFYNPQYTVFLYVNSKRYYKNLSTATNYNWLECSADLGHTALR
jgi:hypothetical protein